MAKLTKEDSIKNTLTKGKTIMPTIAKNIMPLRKLKHKQHEHRRKREKYMCYRRVSSSCSTSGTRFVTLITNPVIDHETVKTTDLSQVT
jgi:hypothetical protein